MQAVDADEHKVIVLIIELYHLLGLAVDRCLDETPEPAYAMVDVDDIVADLDLVELLDGERELTAPGLVGAERIIVEAVEDLTNILFIADLNIFYTLVY